VAGIPDGAALVPTPVDALLPGIVKIPSTNATAMRGLPRPSI
jgi:hypothetical protein